MGGQRSIRLPGGRLGAERYADAVRLGLGALWLLGVWPKRMTRVARRGDRSRVRKLERSWARSVARFLRIKWDIAGLEHVDPARRTVLLPLHEGFADPLALLRLGLDLRFVARDELLEWPTLGRYLRESAQILVREDSPRTSYRRLLAEGKKSLDAGEAVVVFPQGSILGIEVAFWEGAFRFAERLDAHVLPVAVTGTHRVWEYPYSPTVRFNQTVSVRVLPAVPPTEVLTRATAIEQDLKDIALSADTAAPRRFRPEVDGFWDGYRYEIDPRFEELRSLIASRRG